MAMLGFFLACSAQAATSDQLPERLTLAGSIELALQHNRTVQKALLDRVTQRYNLRVAQDKFAPDAFINPFVGYDTSKPGAARRQGVVAAGVTTSVQLRLPTGAAFDFAWTNSGSRLEPAPTDPETDATSYASTLTLSVSQPLLRGGGIDVNTASVKIARLDEELNLINLEATLIDVITSVITAYRSLVQAQQQLEISERSLERAKALLEINQLLIKGGRMAPLDIVQTKAEAASRAFDVTGAQNDVERARLELLALLDIDARPAAQPEPEALRAETPPPDVDRSLELAFQHRPDYRQALLQLKIAKMNLRLAKNNRLWDLSLSASADFDGADNSLGEAVNDVFNIDRGHYRAGLDLVIPFGDLRLKQTYLAAKIALDKAEIDLQELRQNIELQVRDAVRDVDARQRQIDLARQSRELTEQKVEIERDKLKFGLSTNFQLVAFEDDLVQAQNSELSANIAYLNALTALDQTLGTTLLTWQVGLVEQQR